MKTDRGLLKSEDDTFIFKLLNFDEYCSFDFNSIGTNTNLLFL